MNNRVRALESLIAIFLVGLIIGIGGALLWVDRGPQNATDTNSRSAGGYKKNPIKLSGLLHLTQEQDAKIKAIFDDTRRQSAALSKEMGPKFEAIRSEANDKIAAILNDEQKKIWEQFLKERDRDESRDRSGRGGGRNDGGRDGGGPQLQPNPSGPQESQPPGLGTPQLGPNPSGQQQSQPPGFGGPQQQPRGNEGQLPRRGRTGSKSPQPAETEKKSQASS